ncbi:hypothetical protein BDW22DRAFT_1331414 [Trametopsis cervina]|nr:hypothetical protein BDW22DRAFT_1331414 [Trametopsis cervina]
MIDEAARDQNDADRAVRFQKTSGGHDVLRPLWYKVVKPIFAALGLQPTSGRRRPRIWWCPTGLFTFLPIHAAGDHNRFGESCFDYVVSSYTPTCAALLHARKTFNPVRMTEAKVLLGAVPRPFEGPPLKGTVAELEQISGIIPSQQCISLPESDNPILHSHGGLTSQTVLSKLPEASILHLASHGVQDHKNPLESGFILRDAKLTIAQLMPLPLPRAFLAYLSACETAKGDQAQADQAIHLAATMLFAGFKSVVGTMWKMSDCDGPRVASHLYGQLFASQEYLDPDVVPYALDEAVQAMRTEGVSSSRWATFIHLGM